MQSQIQVMLDEMGLAANIIMERSNELNGKIYSVTEHSTSQRNDIQQISNAMDEFSKSVMQVSDDANSSAGSAITSQELIEESNKKMDKTIQSTDKVVIAVRASSSSINNLKEAIQKIGVVSNAIKEIADQTNLLALNAAIEAARAGEQGRGFAVVADEVRKLAERTGSSTNDIANMVSNIHAVSQSVVLSMNEAIKEVEDEAVIVQENGEILKKVIEASRRVTENAQRIAAVSKEQSVASEGVSHSLENVAGLVNSNAQIAEEANLSAQELSKSASALQSMINQLNRKT
jgi:aerotaxis receptor